MNNEEIKNEENKFIAFCATTNWIQDAFRAAVGYPHPNRNPHADMIHEWAETGRTVEILDEFTNTWESYPNPKWIASWKYRWASK